MKKIIFIVSQLVPHTCVSKYETNGKKYLAVWNQWFFKPFNIKRFELA